MVLACVRSRVWWSMIESLVDSFMINRNRNHLEPERALKLVTVNLHSYRVNRDSSSQPVYLIPIRSLIPYPYGMEPTVFKYGRGPPFASCAWSEGFLLLLFLVFTTQGFLVFDWLISGHTSGVAVVDWSVCLLALKHLVSRQARTRTSVQAELDLHPTADR